MRLSTCLLLAIGMIPSLSAPAQTAMTLQEFLGRVLEANQGLEVQRLEERVAEQQIIRETAIFDPILSTSAQYDESREQNTTEDFFRRNQLDLFEEKNGSLDIAVQGVFPTGTRYDVGYTVRRLRNSLDDLEKQYQAVTTFSLTQPLLQNRGVQITKARIHLAERDSEISGEELRSALVSAISDAESTYWDLVLASRELSMRNESVAVAQKLLNDNRERHRLNKLAEVEVYQAETGLKVRQTQYAAARQRLSETINRIRSLLSESSTSTAAKYSAADSPNAPAPNFDKDAVMLAAIEHNPDYSIQKLELEKSNIRLVVADNMRWPRLDLTATYGQNGLDNDSSQAHDFLVDDETHSWALLLEFQMAIGGRQAHSELEAARLRKQQAILNLKRIEIELGNAVDTVLSRIESAHDQRNTFAEVVAFNEKLLEDEQTLMASGKSDSRQVLEIEEELFEAKQSEVRSRIDYQKALLALATLQGTLLEERNITIDKE